jgi:hypothetical protein
MDRQGLARYAQAVSSLIDTAISEEIMNQNQTGSNVLASLLSGKLGERRLTTRQVNKLVATISTQLTPAQQREVKGCFVFSEAPSMSTRSAFQEAAQTIIQNLPVLNTIVA